MIYVLREMLNEFEDNHLEVILVPQSDPPNVGACLRAAAAHNCEWYRSLCSEFESRRKRQYKNYKTKIKRAAISRILKRLIDGRDCNSVYADWILEYARERKRQCDDGEFPF